MREIKFRVWFKGEEPFDPNDLMEHEKPQMIYNVQNLYDGSGCDDNNYILGWASCIGDILDDDRFVIMQYTGFRDDNGIEIYEGDIVIAHYMLTELAKPFKSVVEWDKYRYALRNLDEETFNWHIGGFPMNNLDPFGYSLKIIGNIYQNPDLLSKGGLK